MPRELRAQREIADPLLPGAADALRADLRFDGAARSAGSEISATSWRSASAASPTRSASGAASSTFASNDDARTRTAFDERAQSLPRWAHDAPLRLT